MRDLHSFFIPQDEIFKNGRTRFFYRNGEKIWLDTLICDKKIFNPSKAERSEKPWTDPMRNVIETALDIPEEKPIHNSLPEDVERAARRARKKLFELAVCNPQLTVFVTLTVAPETGKRYSYVELCKTLKDWLNNRVKRKGLCYVLVPEKHKDGAIHFHGLFSDTLPRKDSGTVLVPSKGKPIRTTTADRLKIPQEQRQTVYNLPDWKLGYSTAMLVTDRDNGSYIASAAYVSKYITKQCKVGGRYYLSGGNLQRPQAEYFNCEVSDLSDSNSIAFEICGNAFILKKPERIETNGSLQGSVEEG